MCQAQAFHTRPGAAGLLAMPSPPPPNTHAHATHAHAPQPLLDLEHGPSGEWERVEDDTRQLPIISVQELIQKDPNHVLANLRSGVIKARRGRARQIDRGVARPPALCAWECEGGHAAAQPLPAGRATRAAFARSRSWGSSR